MRLSVSVGGALRGTVSPLSCLIRALLAQDYMGLAGLIPGNTSGGAA
ncbi:hypothetical protein SMD11_7014 [Streptomyces albireticuli]|uniref:Uncharacterized protein n=1 Tax=Streptomyces albireticuli TaxID=1940 RepID=A0A1Z2LE46_9ACTN|nr:hypothetical protein SMD11_7014 [Streptomyces albireticuli]